MNFIEKIRSKSHAEKLRIIWITVAVAAVLMVIVWALTARINKNVAGDTTLFQTIGQGIKDVRNNYHK
jgi:hypothetical protein